FGTPTWPVTYSVLEVTAAVFEPFAVGVTIFFAGHLLWRDRDLGLKPIVDASPHGPALPVLTTFFAMSGVLVTLQALLGAAGVVYQRMNGHTRHEWGTYALDLFVLRFADLLLVLVLSLFVQLLLRRKAIAYLATAAVYLGVRFSPALGLDHVLYRYGHDPGYQFSEVNGVGGFLWGWAVVQGYWTAVAALMLVAGVLLWPRGVDADVAARKRTARRRLTRRTASVSAAAATVALGLGAITVYNVHGLNDYRTPARAEALQVRVEQEMGDWRDRPHPRITDARYAVDLFPRERRADVRGELRLVNPHGEAIETLLLRLPRGFELLELTVDGRAAAEPVELADRYRRLDLGTPLAARAGLDVVYRGRWHERGFGNRHSQGGVLDNGSFIGAALVLGFGYDDGDELQDPQRRRRFGLPARDPLPALDAPGVRGRSLRGDADWTRLEISVTTDADQVALAPGDLVDTRTADDRTTYTYRTATPVQHLWAVVSGSYEVTAERWRGVDLEVYHRPEHDHNVDSMVRGMKRSLEYLTATFGDYPHGALRIVEFPRYATFAMSLPGLIPFSEGIGFIARKRSADDIDYPFYVTAHEVAHLWFPHRASPAHAEGMAFLSETFAQYVALRVMEEQFGPELIGKYLRYELDRYLIGRGVSRFDERSLHTVHHQQHIYYNKGSLAIYRAAELIGRDVMDAALLEYLERFDLDGPPYPTSSDFLEILRRHAAPEHHGTLADLFERITFYDVAVGEASCEALGDARYRVTLDVRASKTYADGVGRETPATLDEPFDVGVFAERRVLLKKKPKTLELERRRFTGDAQVVFEVDQLPLRAGVDPFYTLVDRKPEDNVVDLDCGS
ncbi:MAG: M1 family aminopeptidase, partial [Acidobacteriota bacterium]